MIDHRYTISFKDDEDQLLREVAEYCGMTLTTYIRSTVVRSLRAAKQKMPPPRPAIGRPRLVKGSSS